MKKIALVLVVLFAVGSLLFGGGQQGGTQASGGTPGSAAPMEISVGFWWGNLDPFGNDKVGQFIENKFNVKITKAMYDWSDDADRTRLWASTGMLPDAFSGYPPSTSWFADFINQGVIRSIPYSIISKYPNVKKVTDEHTLGKQLEQFYGGQYFVVRPESAAGYKISDQNGVYYRRDWAEKLGLPKPSNMDEYYQYLRACVYNDPDGNGRRDTYGLTVAGIGDFLYPFGAFSGDWINLPNGKVQPGWLDEEPMVAGLGWYRKLFDEGLIDPEFPRDYTVLQAKFYQNYASMVRSLTPGWGNTIVGIEFAAAHPEIANPWKAIGAVSPLSARVGGTTYWLSQKEQSGTCFNVDVSDAKLDKIIEIFDWTYTQEAQDLAHWGFRDEDYRVDALGRKSFILSLEERTAAHKYDASSMWQYLANWDYDWAVDPSNPDMTQAAIDWGMNEWVTPSNRAAENTKKKINELASFIVTEERSLFTFDVGVAMVEIVTGKDDVRTMYRRMIQDAKDRGLDEMVASVNKAMGL
jgi:putative aldouronate transport system substrate-binding protein